MEARQARETPTRRLACQVGAARVSPAPPQQPARARSEARSNAPPPTSGHPLRFAVTPPASSVEREDSSALCERQEPLQREVRRLGSQTEAGLPESEGWRADPATMAPTGTAQTGRQPRPTHRCRALHHPRHLGASCSSPARTGVVRRTHLSRGRLWSRALCPPSLKRCPHSASACGGAPPAPGDAPWDGESTGPQGETRQCPALLLETGEYLRPRSAPRHRANTPPKPLRRTADQKSPALPRPRQHSEGPESG